MRYYRMIRRAVFVVAGISLLTCLTATRADVVSLSATDAGFVTETGGSSKGDGTSFAPATFKYFAGWEEQLQLDAEENTGR